MAMRNLWRAVWTFKAYCQDALMIEQEHYEHWSAAHVTVGRSLGKAVFWMLALSLTLSATSLGVLIARVVR